MLEASSWALDDAGVLRLRWAFAAKQERILRGEALAALTIERPLLFRLMGASRVVLYPVGQPAKRAVTLYLHKEDAQELADRLMPICDPVCHRPAGGERAAMVRLGANGLSTLALLYLAIRQSRPFPLTAEALALSRLNVLVRFAAHWLPAGAAWMLDVFLHKARAAATVSSMSAYAYCARRPPNKTSFRPEASFLYWLIISVFRLSFIG